MAKRSNILKLICILTALSLALSSCSVFKESASPNIYKDEMSEESVDLSPNFAINPVLYFLNRTRTKLAGETREITIPQNAVPAQYVVEELIKGPVSEDLQNALIGFEYQNIEILPNLVNVFLTAKTEKTDGEILNAKVSLTATLSEFVGTKYVNVMINGKAKGFLGKPTGLMQKLQTDINEEISKFTQKGESINPDLEAALYFLDATEKYILPEARRIVFKNTEYIPAIIEELIKGPEDTYSHRPIIDKNLKLINYEILLKDDGRRIVGLNFNRNPVVFTKDFIDGQKMANAALTFTITTFMPDIDGIEIYVNGAPAYKEIFTISDFPDLFGNDILLYFPNSTYTLLFGVERVVDEKEAGYLATHLKELMNGPVVNDGEDVWPAFPPGVTYDDVLEVYIAEDIVVLNFKEQILDKLKNLNPQDEYMMIFSIVNTLTSIEGIKKVQFLVEGKRANKLAQGEIDIIDPIIKNPGIIKA